MSDFFLKALNVKKSYRTSSEKIDVLKGLDFRLQRGEIVSIIGESGSGKSTLLHILGGMDLPDDGSVLIDGVDITSLDLKERSRFRNENIGFVFQFHYLLPEFTVMENLKIPLMIGKRHSRGEVEEICIEILNLVGLFEKRNRKPDELSGGQQQLLAIGRAMVNSPRLLLMDEPTGNLDEETSKRVMEKLFKILEELEITTVIVTHNISLARRTEKIYRLSGGNINLEKY